MQIFRVSSLENFSTDYDDANENTIHLNWFTLFVSVCLCVRELPHRFASWTSIDKQFDV